MEAVARMLPLHALGSAISCSVAGGVVWRLPVASQFTKTMRGTYLRGLINYKAHYNVPRLAVGFHAGHAKADRTARRMEWEHAGNRFQIISPKHP